MKDTLNEYKARVHQENYSDGQLILNSKDFPDVVLGDVFKICLPSAAQCIDTQKRCIDYTRTYCSCTREKCISLQVKSITNDIPKGTVSIHKNAASVLGITAYQTVLLKLLDKQEIELYAIELAFKDQYIGRRDMWCLKEALRDRCVYYGGKLEHDCIRYLATEKNLFIASSLAISQYIIIRCQIDKLWFRNSDRIIAGNSGYISKNTKIIFRSSRAMIFLMIQMSREMWEFDIGGDLYFEKTIEFLSVLFNEWKVNSCDHDVTIVLFSRTIYNLEAFESGNVSATKETSPSYEDFYRVVTLSERRNDWSTIIIQLKRYFGEYLCHVNVTTPEGSSKDGNINSSYSQGNCLEAMNLALNLLEKHYIDRNFDRTGQCITVITAGPGIIEAEKQLIDITKQRISDYGIAADLVCLGESPLYYVPLLKIKYAEDKYEVPDDWINLSGYVSKTQLELRKKSSRYYVPRIKFSSSFFDALKNSRRATPAEQILKIFESDDRGDDFDWGNLLLENMERQSDDGDSIKESKDTTNHLNVKDDDRSVSNEDDDDSENIKIFYPSLMKNRGHCYSRWNDVVLQSPVVSKADNQNDDKGYELPSCIFPSKTIALAALKHMNERDSTLAEDVQQPEDHEVIDENTKNVEEYFNHYIQEFTESASEGINGLKSNHGVAYYYVNPKREPENKRTIYATDSDTFWDFYERVDWRSLTAPACLPLTNREYPSREDILKEYSATHEVRQSDGFSESEIEGLFQVMVLQRISQGFQVYYPIKDNKELSKPFLSSEQLQVDIKNVYKLSIGLILHELYLTEHVVHLVKHYPKKSQKTDSLNYKYNLWPIHRSGFQQTMVELKSGELRDLDWQSIDNYVMGKIDRSHEFLNELVKFWQLRFALLPVHSSVTSSKATILNYLHIMVPEKSTEMKSLTCVYSERLKEIFLLEQFLKFAENLNRCRRSSHRQSLSKPPQLKAFKAFVDPDESITSGTIYSDADKSMETRKENISGEEGARSTSDNSSKTISSNEVVQLMQDISAGLPFLDKQRDIPNKTFVSATFVGWVIESIDSVHTITDALALGQRLLDEKLIIKITNSRKNQFIFGYHVYCIASSNETVTEFSDRWVEIEIYGMKNVMPSQESEHLQYRCLQIEVDHKKQLDKNFQEWFTVNYSTNYKPRCAYRFEVRWLISSATDVNETIQDWGRRARAAGFLLTPVPYCPFPTSNSVHPFYSPAEIDIDLSWLVNDDAKEEGKNTTVGKFRRFVKLVMDRLEFIIDPGVEIIENEQLLFIHSSGAALVKYRIRSKEEQINKLCDTTNLKEAQVDFLWSQNYMLPKRSSSTSDNQQDKLLPDFQKFWTNSDNKLKEWWKNFIEAE
ncbi:DEP domain-containing protein 5 [Trichoplax sp. H2]|nr:DEP domain-containing protein 5 [Trichoplax sp. H2]|eukprot:RDD44762.1 DEP domain-containing protein 5 [Trichoplax sp. H2]